jgi:hypothetical protein
MRHLKITGNQEPAVTWNPHEISNNALRGAFIFASS